jgi:hypothetical protein
MIKPHEEEWKTGEGVLSGALYSGDKWIGSFSNPERARLAEQAPGMARIIAAILSSPGGPGPHGYGAAVVTIPAHVVADAVAFLCAAGVIP